MRTQSLANPRYLVGIDLGTTHTVVAYTNTQTQAGIQLFEIEQLVAAGEVSPKRLLPSVRYHPANEELADQDVHLPWQKSSMEGNAILGQWARVLGAKSQGRLVVSAKSWLSHAAVDRTADILPWGSADEIEKLSPVAASASYLAHVRAAWNSHFPDAPLEQQTLVITIPASFDEAARSLTLEAAHIAGLKHIHLLEEPQAVCYDWLRRHQDHLKKSLQGIRLLMVCDIGGGTTDLTLIQVKPDESGQPQLNRVGVGDHLMLGGDNIDLSLARLAESRLVKAGERLSVADLSMLIEQCRAAKENLLSETSLEQVAITLLGRGGKLIGGTRSVQLSRQEVQEIVMDGFFPLSELTQIPDRKRSGVVEFGLPYVADPAVSKHIAAFLNAHQKACREALGNDQEQPVPDAILLNGGLFRSQQITQRMLDLVSFWSGRSLKRLDNDQPELAVAYGAVSYAMARRGEQVKIGGGSARSYFLIIDQENDTQQGICILPRGSEEAFEVALPKRIFSLRIGQPVRFHLVSTSEDTNYQPGELVIIEDQVRFPPLPPLAVALDPRSMDNQREVKVQLVTSFSDIGTLQIQCVAIENPDQRWDVEFQLRRQSAQTGLDEATLPPHFEAAAEQIKLVFGNKSKQVTPKMVKGLRNDLEKHLGTRNQWNTPLLRELFAVLLEGLKRRRRSENHERVWLSLTGFCLRPGFGYALDDWRIEQFWNTYAQGIQFVNEAQNWSEWWTLWRRVAGGLNTEQQSTLLTDISKYIDPATGGRQKNVSTQAKKRGYDDIVRLAAVLERVPVEQKIQLGHWLLKRLQKPSEPDQSWWALGRIGARIPFHGSTHNVVDIDSVSAWLQPLLQKDWKKTPHIGFAVTMMSRMSGDQTRDIELQLRQQVIEKLKLSKAPASWLEMVESVTELDEADEKRIFGEALPPGLKLLDS